MMFQKTLEKMRKNEGGFTLIELLVVMIIIGILAAIAIPLFLSQKTKAHETAMKNDLRNAATYFETYAVDNNGGYANLDTVDQLKALGFKGTDGVELTIVANETTGTAFQVHATYKGDTGAGAYTYNSAADVQLSKDGAAIDPDLED